MTRPTPHSGRCRRPERPRPAETPIPNSDGPLVEAYGLECPCPHGAYGSHDRAERARHRVAVQGYDAPQHTLVPPHAGPPVARHAMCRNHQTEFLTLCPAPNQSHLLVARFGDNYRARHGRASRLRRCVRRQARRRNERREVLGSITLDREPVLSNLRLQTRSGPGFVGDRIVSAVIAIGCPRSAHGGPTLMGCGVRLANRGRHAATAGHLVAVGFRPFADISRAGLAVRLGPAATCCLPPPVRRPRSWYGASA
jgi:hypothetical protein